MTATAMPPHRRANDHLLHDLFVIAVSLGAAWYLAETGVLYQLLTSVRGLEFFGSFVAGIFFTSVFTTAPAIIALGEIARFNDIIPVAFFGALGAMLGDFVIFRFVRDEFSSHILELLKHQGVGRRIVALFRLKLFRWFSFFVGGLIIASPLPDELGIGLLGFSRIKIAWFAPLSLFFNFIGILLIGAVARSL